MDYGSSVFVRMFDLILINLCILPACLSLIFVVLIDTFILAIHAISTGFSFLASSITIILTRIFIYLLFDLYELIIWFFSILPDPEDFEEEYGGEEEEEEEEEEYVDLYW